MYREHKIRSMHAYLFNIIKRRENSAGNRLSKSIDISYKGHNRLTSAQSSRERTREPSLISESDENALFVSDEHTADVLGDTSLYAQSWKSFEYESRKSNTRGGGEANDKVSIPFNNEQKNSLELNDWKSGVLPSRVFTVPPERFIEELRYCRRVRKCSKKYPYCQRRPRRGYDTWWSTKSQEIDVLSDITVNGAEFTTGCVSYPLVESGGNPVVRHCERINSESKSIDKAYLGQDCYILDRYLVEDFPDILDITDSEPGEYSPQQLHSRFPLENPLIDLLSLE